MEIRHLDLYALVDKILEKKEEKKRETVQVPLELKFVLEKIRTIIT